ncbi:hypothetical protein TruAng_002109 [Truncatella angustata]|nr:hypothetical protein TruAng_002109 [Truncatella angustata]
MFYTGKSTACHTCRQRRLKCDEVRPHCLKCKRAGRECLGYRDESAFIIRDMTTATIQKFEHKPKSATPASSSSLADDTAPPISETDGPGSAEGGSTVALSPAASSSASFFQGSFSLSADEEFGSERDRRKIRKQKSWVEHQGPRKKRSMMLKQTLLALPLEDRALCYFASRYAFAPTQFLDPGYLPVLKAVSQKESLGPCLSASLSAVSLAAFSTKANARKAIVRARAQYATALQMTNEAIQRSKSYNDDELLASVVLLALFEVFCSENILGWGSHIFGAAAMLGARGKVSLRDKLVRALFRVVSNESVKLHMLGVSSPHTGTEVWLQWLTEPRYMTYITPAAEAADPNAADMLDLARNMDGLSFQELASLKGADAVDQIQSGRAGTLPVPQLSPAPPVGYAGPQGEDETISITLALLETKKMIMAYSEKFPPIPDLDEPTEPLADLDQSRTSDYVTDVDKTYQKLATISLLAAALSPRATRDYNEAVSMGRKEIREILRMAPHFFRLIEESSGLTNSNRFLSSSIAREYESSSSSDDSSIACGDEYLVSKTQRSVPNLAKSYIGLMILWPVATAASTDLVDADQFKYIMGMLDYIINVCGIRMGDGVRQFCVEKRQLSGAPFFA